MKNKTLFKILVLMAAGVGMLTVGGSVLAEEMVTLEGVHLWTADELMALDDLLKAEKDELCGDDEFCRMNLHFEQIERGEKFRAVDAFNMAQVTVTEINSSENVLKYVYHDEDPMMGGYKRTLKKLGIAWFEDPMVSVDPLEDIEPVGVHYLMHRYFDEFVPQIEANVEHEIDTEEAGLEENVLGRISFWLVESEGGVSFGTIDYSSCLDAPGYAIGGKCVAYYDECGNVKYFFKAFDEGESEEKPNTEMTTEAMNELGEEAVDEELGEVKDVLDEDMEGKEAIATSEEESAKEKIGDSEEAGGDLDDLVGLGMVEMESKDLGDLEKSEEIRVGLVDSEGEEVVAMIEESGEREVEKGVGGEETDLKAPDTGKEKILSEGNILSWGVAIMILSISGWATCRALRRKQI